MMLTTAKTSTSMTYQDILFLMKEILEVKRRDFFLWSEMKMMRSSIESDEILKSLLCRFPPFGHIFKEMWLKSYAIYLDEENEDMDRLFEKDDPEDSGISKLDRQIQRWIEKEYGHQEYLVKHLNIKKTLIEYIHCPEILSFLEARNPNTTAKKFMTDWETYLDYFSHDYHYQDQNQKQPFILLWTWGAEEDFTNRAKKILEIFDRARTYYSNSSFKYHPGKDYASLESLNQMIFLHFKEEYLQILKDRDFDDFFKREEHSLGAKIVQLFTENLIRENDGKIEPTDVLKWAYEEARETKWESICSQTEWAITNDLDVIEFGFQLYSQEKKQSLDRYRIFMTEQSKESIKSQEIRRIQNSLLLREICEIDSEGQLIWKNEEAIQKILLKEFESWLDSIIHFSSGHNHLMDLHGILKDPLQYHIHNILKPIYPGSEKRVEKKFSVLANEKSLILEKICSILQISRSHLDLILSLIGQTRHDLNYDGFMELENCWNHQEKSLSSIIWTSPKHEIIQIYRQEMERDWQRKIYYGDDYPDLYFSIKSNLLKNHQKTLICSDAVLSHLIQEISNDMIRSQIAVLCAQNGYTQTLTELLEPSTKISPLKWNHRHENERFSLLSTAVVSRQYAVITLLLECCIEEYVQHLLKSSKKMNEYVEYQKILRKELRMSLEQIDDIFFLSCFFYPFENADYPELLKIVYEETIIVMMLKSQLDWYDFLSERLLSESISEHPLLQAVKLGNLKMVQKVYHAGYIDLTQLDQTQRNIFHILAIYRHDEDGIEIAKWLMNSHKLKHNASLETQCPETLMINSYDSFHRPPLYYAIEKKNFKIAEFLLSQKGLILPKIEQMKILICFESIGVAIQLLRNIWTSSQSFSGELTEIFRILIEELKKATDSASGRLQIEQALSQMVNDLPRYLLFTFYQQMQSDQAYFLTYRYPIYAMFRSRLRNDLLSQFNPTEIAIELTKNMEQNGVLEDFSEFILFYIENHVSDQSIIYCLQSLNPSVQVELEKIFIDFCQSQNLLLMKESFEQESDLLQQDPRVDFILKFLKKQGYSQFRNADIGWKNRKFRMMILHQAWKRVRESLHDPEILMNTEDKYGRTVLHDLIYCDQESLLTEIIEKRPGISISDRLVLFAIEREHEKGTQFFEITKLLIRHSSVSMQPHKIQPWLAYYPEIFFEMIDTENQLHHIENHAEELRVMKNALSSILLHQKSVKVIEKFCGLPLLVQFQLLMWSKKDVHVQKARKKWLLYSLAQFKSDFQNAMTTHIEKGITVSSGVSWSERTHLNYQYGACLLFFTMSSHKSFEITEYLKTLSLEKQAMIGQWTMALKRHCEKHQKHTFLEMLSPFEEVALALDLSHHKAILYSHCIDEESQSQNSLKI